jgi:hypothetical protein
LALGFLVVAEIENPNSGMTDNKWFTTVVLPLPEGAEKIMTLFKADTNLTIIIDLFVDTIQQVIKKPRCLIGVLIGL